MTDIMETIKLAQAGDRKAKSTLIEENSRLIWSVVKKFIGRGTDAEDLFQIGAIGLIKCINKFDVSYNVKFSTYAVPMIMGEIKRFLRDDGMIKVSRSMKELSNKAKYMKEYLYIKKGEYPTVNELASALDVEIDELLPALEVSGEIESIYSTLSHNDGSETYLLDRLVDKNDYHQSYFKEDIMFLKDLICKLSEKERQIIVMRYFHDRTQTQIASLLGISQVQVSRLEKKILAQMKQKME